MKVKVTLTTGLSGPFFSGSAGDIYECDEAEAVRLIAAGFAVAIRSEPEKAINNPADNPKTETRIKKGK